MLSFNVDHEKTFHDGTSRFMELSAIREMSDSTIGFFYAYFAFCLKFSMLCIKSNLILLVNIFSCPRKKVICSTRVTD